MRSRNTSAAARRRTFTRYARDYRAAVSIDLVHDEADLHKKLAQPVLVLWGERSHVNRSYKPIEAWRERAADVRGRMLPCGHYPAEQTPVETYAELRAFFIGDRASVR